MTKNISIDKTARFYADKLFGSNIRIDRGVHCTANISLGFYVHISPYVVIIGGDKSRFIAQAFNNIMVGAKIICASDKFDSSGLPGSLIPGEYSGTVVNQPVIMEKFSNIGTGAIVMPGSTLREGVLLCAGSLLIGDTVPWGVYKGNPAVLVHKVDGTKIKEYAKKLGYEI